MSEHSRNYHSRSTDARNDRHSDDPSYRETHDEYDHNRVAASHHNAFDDEYRLHSDHYNTHEHTSHSAASHHDPQPDYQPSYSEQNFPESEEVWLKEKLSRISYNDHDLQDIKHAKHSTIMRTMAGFAGLAGILGLIGFLAISSVPDLSPEEIIAMEGYAGEQTTKTPFNLASLRNCDAGADCSNAVNTEIIPITSTSDRTAGNPVTRNASEINIARNNSETTDSPQENYREIPAAVSTAVSVTENKTAGRSTTRSPDFSNSDLVVLQQWSNVRGTPDINGEILTSLAKGANVIKISQAGSWIEVQVAGRKQVTGYMHRSTVGEL